MKIHKRKLPKKKAVESQVKTVDVIVPRVSMCENDYFFVDQNGKAISTVNNQESEAREVNPPQELPNKDLSIWDKNTKNVCELLDLIVNGTPISQLLLDKYPDLTERAAKELITLEEKTISDTLLNSREELEELRKKISEEKESYRRQLEKKELLEIEIEALKKKKESVLNGINQEEKVDYHSKG